MPSLSPSTVYSPQAQNHGGYYGWRFRIDFSIANTSGSTSTINWSVTCDGTYGNSTWIRVAACTFSINGTQVASAASEYVEGMPTSGHVVFSGTTSVTGTSFTYAFTGGYYLYSSSECNVHGAVTISGLTYTVTFDLAGGTRTGGGALTQTVTAGGSATPPTCTKTGYDFAGWSGSYTNVTSNRTITAQWDIQTFTVIFDLDGGTRTGGGALTQTINYGSNATPPTCSRTGYSFAGWSGTYTNITSSRTITALWTRLSYTVTFDLDGGTRTGGGQLVQTVYYGEDATPPTCTRTGYTFNGWSGTYTNVTSTRTITATWDIITYQISYNANGGSGAPSSQTKTYGQTLVLTNSTPTTPKRYTITFNTNGGTLDTASKVVECPFTNWNTNASGTGTSYQSGGNYTANEAATLYAQWGYATAGDLPEPTITQGEFTGWFTALHGGTQIIETSDIGSSMTLYARYNYEVTYTSRAYYYPGESDEPVEFEMADQTKVYDETLQLWDITPQYDGYQFRGWATSSTSSTATYQPGDNYTANAPLNLYGLYSEPAYTVTFVNGFGTTLKTQQVTYGGSATPPANPTYPNRKFVGWNGNYTNVTSDRTITAMWDATPVWICRVNASGNKYWEKML